MKKLIAYYLVGSCLVQCKDPETTSIPKQLEYVRDSQLTIPSGVLTIPKGWKLLQDDPDKPQIGDATARFQFEIQSGKIIHIEDGLSVSQPFELDIVPSALRAGYLQRGYDTTGWLFSDDPRLTGLIMNLPYEVSDTILHNSCALKYIPKKWGTGISGIYFDSIGEASPGQFIRLTVYGKNLNEIEYSELMAIILSWKPAKR